MKSTKKTTTEHVLAFTAEEVLAGLRAIGRVIPDGSSMSFNEMRDDDYPIPGSQRLFFSWNTTETTTEET